MSNKLNADVNRHEKWQKITIGNGDFFAISTSAIKEKKSLLLSSERDSTMLACQYVCMK